tara:strand:+ start:585 stop:704 length:120 start_codon:yes stop_codon:yes gene_type:complete
MEKNKIKIKENEIVLYAVVIDFCWNEKIGLISEAKIIEL